MKEELFEEYLKDQIRIRDKELDKFRPFTSAYEMKKEIERLKEMKLHTEKYASEMEGKYILEKYKNDKAIKYIEQESEHINNLLVISEDFDIEKVLDKLKGVDEE